MSHFNFKTFALATALLTPVAAQAGLCDNGICDPADSYGDSESYGNSKFGVGYDFSLSVENRAGTMASIYEGIEYYTSIGNDAMVSFLEAAVAASPVNELYTHGSLSASVDATVFGEDLVIISADASATLDETISYSASGTLIGADVDVAEFDAAEIPLFSAEMTFFKVSTTYMAGPLPVTVKGEVTGEVGATGSVTMNDGIALGVTPYANLSAEADASVGVACVRAGINGTLTLIDIEVPTTLTFAESACGVSIDLDSQIDMSTMDGKIKVYAKACGYDWSKKLIDWDGATLDPIELIDEGVDICF